MSNYGWTNEDGEPIMDGAAWRFEQQLDMDSRDDYYADHFYDYDPEPVAPEDCDHGDHSTTDKFSVECDICEATGLRVVNNWPMDGDYDPQVEDFIVWNV